MHHFVVESWSRRRSPLHARDARVKLLATLVFLVTLATVPSGAWWMLGVFGILALAAALASRLPLPGLLLRAALVLPFPATFAALTWWSGEGQRAASLVGKAYLSALASVLLIATTPVVDLAAALEKFRVPRLLVLVIQFLYRYLFVISEQAQHMRLASASRGAGRRSFAAAAGAVATLFGRSWERADRIHAAMLARGFDGVLRPLTRPHFHAADFGFLALASAACLLARLLP